MTHDKEIQELKMIKQELLNACVRMLQARELGSACNQPEKFAEICKMISRAEEQMYEAVKNAKLYEKKEGAK